MIRRGEIHPNILASMLLAAFAMAATASGQIKDAGGPVLPGSTPDPYGPFDHSMLAKESPSGMPAGDELISATASSSVPPTSNGQAGPNGIAISKKQPLAPSTSSAVELSGVPVVQLAPLDPAALLAEDETQPQTCKRLRISVGRDVQITGDFGQWYDLPDGGRIWSVLIDSPGALGLRVHFSDVDLLYGVELWVVAPEHAEGADGPHLRRGPLNDGQFWSGTTEGSRVRVELFVPAAAIGAPIIPPRIDMIQHVYRNPLGPAPGEDSPVPHGTCHNDVTCNSTFTNVSHGVARISFVENGNGFLCSGSLFNSQNGDLTPYFLTSNTCIASNTVAQTTQFFWLYQTSSCNGTPPTLSSVPKSSVATLAATGTSLDFTILMEEGALPCGLFWPGIDANAIANGQTSACIHHPQGGAKRISFGTKAAAAADSCISAGTNFVRINWTDGTSESGSEGAPIFRNDTQRIYGQLSCGPSTCANVTYDNFGAFSATFSGSTTVQTLVAGGSDDALEPNDTCATAITITEGTFTNRVVKFNHDDWFKITVPAAGVLSATVTFTNANGNIDIELFSACGGAAVASSSGSTNTESFVFTNTGAAANFLLHVFLSDCDTRNTYSMVLSASLANDSCANATAIPPTATAFNPAPFSTTAADASAGEPQESCETGNSGVSNSVWYSFTPCGTGTVTIDTFGSSYDTVLAMFTGTCAAGVQVACSDNAIGTQARLLNVPVNAGTTYLIKVSDFNTTAGGGTLDFNFTYAPAAPSNDACAAAIVIPSNATAFNPSPFCTVGAAVAAGDPAESCGFTTNSNPVWYSFTPCGDGRISVDSNGSTYDTVLSVFSGACALPVEIACDDDSGTGLNSQLINVPVTQGTNYLIKIADFGNPDGGTLDFNFSYTPTGSLANDNCASPTIIPKNTLVYAPAPYCTVGANAVVSEPQESCEVGGVGVSNTVWYRFTACASGTISLDTNGSDYDTVLSVFTGSCNAAVQIACDDDSGTGSNSQLTNVLVTAGTSYLIKVADYGGPNGGTLVFHLSYTPTPPANDLCSAATLIGTNTFNPAPICTLGATTTPGEPGEACGAPPNGHSVWYRFVPAFGGLATADTFGSNYDTVLSIFSGSCAAAAPIACNDDTNGVESSLVGVPLSAGTTYLIKVAAYGPDNGGTLDFNFVYQVLGDMDCDGTVTLADVPPFIAALLDPAGFVGCNINLGDVNQDGQVNGKDISLFANALTP